MIATWLARVLQLVTASGATAVAGGIKVAPVVHGRRCEHWWRGAKSPGKVMEMGTYPCDVSPVRCGDSRWVAAFWRRWTSAVTSGDVEGILQLCEGKEIVRHRGIKEENGRRWRSPIEEEGGSKSVAPDGGFRRRGGQTASPSRGEAARGFGQVDLHAKWGGQRRELSAAPLGRGGERNGEMGAGSARG
jgi:hypothetical protein